MFFIYLLFCGILIGAAMMSPGVSGGVLAVILGIYDKMIYSLTNLFKNFKKNFVFLFFLGIGVLVGAVYFSKILIFLFDKYEIQTKFLFMGLILGGIPFLYKTVIKKNEEINIKIIIITISFSLILLYFSSNSIKINIDTSNLLNNFISMFIAGFLYSIGKVVPGISGAFILVMLGVYNYLLNIIANPFSICLYDIFKLIPFVIGFILGVIIFLKLINYLLKNKLGITYSIIIGFIIGSVPVLIPKFNNIFSILSGLLFIIIGYFISIKLSK